MMSKYRHQTVYRLIEAQAKINSTKVALSNGACSSLNYSDLLQTVDALVSDLYSAGIDPRDRVSIVMPNGVDLAVTLLAVSSFAPAAPLNPAYKLKEIESYFRELRVKWLVLLDDQAPPAVDAARPPNTRLIRISKGSRNLMSDRKRAAPASVASIAAVSDDVCLILLTSGSTGRSKKVPLTHRNVLASTADICESLLLSAADRCLCMWEQFHIGGLVDLLLVPLASGGSVVCTSGFSAKRLFELTSKGEITWFQAVPTTLYEVTIQAQRIPNRVATHKLRFVRSVAASLSQPLMEEIESLFGVPVIQTLGMTEAGPLITTNRLHPGGRKARSVGLPAGPEVKIVGSDGNELPPETIGQILIRGENVFAG